MLKRLFDSMLVAKARSLQTQLRDSNYLCKRHTDRIAECTAEIQEARGTIETQADQIVDLERQLSVARHDSESLRAKLDISDARVEMLTEVVQRDRERVSAETAIYAQMKEGVRPYAHAGTQAGELMGG